MAGNRILVTRFKSIGDILFTLPAVHALRENFPDHKISFLTSKEFTPLLAGFRDVDEVLSLDRSVIRGGNLIHMAQEMCSLVAYLYQKQFALAVDFQGYGETALITWLTRAPHRWGTVYRSLRSYAYTQGIRRNPKIHPAESNLHLLKQCGISLGAVRNDFIPPENSMAEARKLFEKLGLDSRKPTVFIQPFTSSPHKDWPIENFLELATHLRRAGVQVLFGGGPRELARLQPALQANFPAAAGAPLLVSAALAKLCTVFVGGDTGLLHIAVAMNKRVVMIQGPHRYQERFYPFRNPEWKLMSPPDGAISAVGVREVIKAVEVAFAECACQFAVAVGE
jgi:ADP-heptose:LPS heptosyltransferase